MPRGQHLADDLLSPRARTHYQLSPPGLVLSGLRQLDQGGYICRADFIHSPSRVGVTNLTLIVPPDVPKVYDSAGTRLLDVTPPVAEGQPLTLTCEASGEGTVAIQAE
ncbi:uncharacterized protein LOC119094429 [Pollicipes pollicipes]|uniref:uncharacterized protein LOC119094429 n=1 Tax=Pollicipes pollicipes TaxID=41117 RepID=UPI0018853B2B|nr:uncharacterized protein LOC119094429 [Pollicipes pollicipes]